MGWARVFVWVAAATALGAVHAPSWAQSPEGAEKSPPEAEQEPGPLADPLASAKAAIVSAKFDVALKRLNKTLLRGGNGAGLMAEVYQLIGETSVAVGQTEAAMAAFRALLVLHPEATLDEMVSPKIVEVFEAARTDLNGATLVLRHQINPDSRQLVLTVETDPLSMIAEVQVRYHRGDGSSAQLSLPVAEGRAELDVPGQATGALEILVFDRSGNTLRVLEISGLKSVAPKPSIQIVSKHQEDPGMSTPVWRKWWVWAGGAGVFVVTGTAFGIASQGASSDLDERITDPGNTSFGQAQALEDKARSRALLANLSFAAAAGLGVASAVFYWQERRLERVQLSATTDGNVTSVVLGGRF